jgi:UDP-N-acetylmuramoyl-L-alanyl-D-glutamate--2,6-diaminopimelate ligase
MNLGELLERVQPVETGVDRNTEVTSLAYDSRRVGERGVFFAIDGEKTDGHLFIEDAIRRGAVAIVSEREAPAQLAAQWVRVRKIRRALSEAARRFYDDPDLKLRLIGITGTNGKTTTAYLLNSIFEAAGTRTGLFGTVEYRLGTRVIAASNTTPESLDLAAYFHELVESGAKAAILEVSSHALAQERVWGIHFSASVFTNLTRDHLDYHHDFEQYFAAKQRLFEGLGSPPPELAVINVDDGWARRLLALPNPRRITYGMESKADVGVKRYSQDLSGLSTTLTTPQGEVDIKSGLLGRANVMNLLAAFATALGLGIPIEKIQSGLGSLAAVPGRLERIDEGQPFLVLVDYAHTDDALRNVLEAARGLAGNRVIVVFGCGGERDRSKRPVMGEVAGSLSDLTVLTSDNPRSEDPILIMNDVLVGLQRTGMPYWAEVDREAAIRKALAEAREGDVVILAGKGHETYQVLKDKTVPFDDRQVARGFLREMGFHIEAANESKADSPQG